MNIILLSGGSGTRLWPLSNDIRSKQFIKIFKRSNNVYESMVERIYRQIKNVDNDANIVIATSKSQISAVKNQLGDNVGISLEPCRRDTFPAILLASMYLKEKKNIDSNETVIVCPVDPYVDNTYFEAIEKLNDLVQNGDSQLVLMGIEPTYPSAKYGYIIPKSKEPVTQVSTFKEKPSEKIAAEYIKQGALWNAGVFAFKLSYIEKIGHELLKFKDYDDLFENYASLKKISFDYAVVEHEKSIQVMRYSGQWKDLGTWNTLTESMSENVVGKGLIDETSKNTHILNELNIPVLALGLNDLVIAASPDGILVSNKERSAHMKPYVEKIKENVKYAEKSWGSFVILDQNFSSLTAKLTIKPGASMSYHSHAERKEIWNVIDGRGYVIINNKKRAVYPGTDIAIQPGDKHMIHANTEMTVMEVQIGEKISTEDKKKFKLEYKTADNNSKALFDLWCEKATEDKDVTRELLNMKEKENLIKEAFYKDLTFGTGGLRGVIGAGTNMLNIYTIAKATQGVAEYLLSRYENPSVIVGYDSRKKSKLFSKITCEVFAGNNIPVKIYSELCPVPMVSYAIRHEGASIGIMITASHNPSKYNGYKVYGDDGCQITKLAANEIYSFIESVDTFKNVKRTSFEEGLQNNLISYISNDTWHNYIEITKKESLIYNRNINKDVKIIYTPLNGAGLKPVLTVLKESGYTNVRVVKEQELPDGNFPTCPYPNPEVKEAMALGIEYCKKYDADLLLATDPDCDRVGIAVKGNDGEFKLLTANQIGVLLLDFICSIRKENNDLPKDGEFVKTIVTTDLAARVADSYGLKTVNTLTGFKYIGEEISRLENKKELGRFVFGFEESYGYLSGTYVRDKDGVNASLLICDMFAYYKSIHVSLIDKLESIYKKYGYCLNSQNSYKFEGSQGMNKMNKIMDDFRSIRNKVGNFKILKIKDYSIGIENLPKSNVLNFILEGNSSIIIRPSGTEPKLKVYFSVFAENMEDAKEKEKQLAAAMKNLIK